MSEPLAPAAVVLGEVLRLIAPEGRDFVVIDQARPESDLARRVRDLADDLEADVATNNARAAVAALTSATLACMYRGRAETSRDAAERLRALLRP